MAGTTNIQGSGTLGTGPNNVVTSAAIGLGTVVNNGAVLQLQGGVTLNESLTLNGGTLDSLTGNNVLNGGIILNAASTIETDAGGTTTGTAQAASALVINGIISGAADLTKTGTATLALTGINTYTGQTNITAGIVQDNAIAALGAVTGNAVVSSGATLQLNPSGSLTYLSKQVVLNGSGLGLTLSGLLLGTGALQSIANTNTWTGNIVLASNALVSSTVNTLTLTGTVSGTGGLTKVGANTLILAAASTFTGATTVSAGTLTLGNVGTLSGTSGVTVNVNFTAGATLQLDNQTGYAGNSAFNVSGRVYATAPVTLFGGTFTELGSNTIGAATSDTFGALNLTGGNSTINTSTGSGLYSTASLTFASLTRLTGATVNFNANGIAGVNQSIGSPGNTIKFTTAPTLTNGILPYATVNTLGVAPVDFVAYGANGIAPYTNYVTSLAAAGPTSNVRLTANETLLANKTIGSLLIVGSLTVSENNFTLTVASGGVLGISGATPTISGGTLDFGSAEGILQANVSTTITSTITGTGGLTISGPGMATLNVANNYTGGTTYNGPGTLALGNISSLGNGAFTMTAGNLSATAAANQPIANAFNLNNSVVTLGLTNRTFFTGPITLTGNNQLTLSNPTLFSGATSGGSTASLNLDGGILVMQNPNSTYSGGTNVGGGNLQVNSSDTVVSGNITNGPLGTGAINLTGGTFQNGNTSVPDFLANSITLHNAITLANASATIAGGAASAAGAGGNVNLAGPMSITGNANSVSVDGNSSSFNLTFSGNISGSGSLTKAGAGPLLLSGNNTFSGGVNVTAGAGVLGNVGNLIVGSNTALGTGLLTLAGGTLQDDGNALADRDQQRHPGRRHQQHHQRHQPEYAVRLHRHHRRQRQPDQGLRQLDHL